MTEIINNFWDNGFSLNYLSDKKQTLLHIHSAALLVHDTVITLSDFNTAGSVATSRPVSNWTSAEYLRLGLPC